MRKYSRQREGILQYLSGTKEHPTADVVYTKLRDIYPNISLGTVYRNLSLLAESGEIQKISCGDGSEHFDYNAAPHYHFRCRECGCVKDVPMEGFEKLNELAAAGFDGLIEGHKVLFYGICGVCKHSI